LPGEAGRLDGAEQPENIKRVLVTLPSRRTDPLSDLVHFGNKEGCWPGDPDLV
jgi:hypothetical protein